MGEPVHYYTDVLKKYAVFSGRATRREYWMFTLIDTVFLIALILLDSYLGTTVPESVYALAVLLPTIGVSVRRLHDTGRSGWWIVVALVPLIGAFWLLWVMTIPSSTDESYGPYPGTADPLPAH
ncbi:DUF805 domain-containing protein [Streptomyces sp. NBC_01232]|uniref:DUF805 domain-containing protein n=1 Tax=unclassified Streptomyces TaxID=2593676 RepID=UPI002E11D82E|nr:DUF805 domain-containing protein [Streptomyces sp. NBC_01232]